MKRLFGRQPQRNYLEMIPVRNVSGFVKEEDRITLLVPKFKSARMQKWLIPSRRSPHFRIHLDEIGSAVWELIDGERNAGQICDALSEKGLMGAESPEDRVTRFLSKLYHSRFIIFKE
jgi:hypothetical protein